MDRLRFLLPRRFTGGIPPQQNGKWLIFGKESRDACVIPGPSEARSPQSISAEGFRGRAQSDAPKTTRHGMTRIGFCALHA
jgi:hypothetical protein